MVTWAPFCVIEGTMVMAVAPLPMTITLFTLVIEVFWPKLRV